MDGESCDLGTKNCCGVGPVEKVSPEITREN